MAGVSGFRFLSACVAVVATLQACARPHAKVERYNGEPAVMVDGKVALAMKDVGGAKSVFCAAQVIQHDLLAAIAENAGCHIYSRHGDVLYASERFVAIHAKDDGRRTIRFKRRCSPYEVYEKRHYGKDVDHIDVDMTLGQTLMWRVDK